MDQDFTFDANDQALSTILFSNEPRRFRIPRYQRPYAWENDNITDFWEDILQSDKSYFLDHLYFNTEHVKDDGFIDIIDGQQRLLTITIFLAVLRDLCFPIDGQYVSLIQSHEIAINDHEGFISSFRIKPAESLELFFQDYIQNFEKKTLILDQKHWKKKE